MICELYYFTGTGNTLYITNALTQLIGKTYKVKAIPINKLDLTKPIKSTADSIGIIFPVYFLDAPDIVKQFSKQLRTRQDTYTFVIANCGAQPGNTLRLVAKRLHEVDIKLNASFTLYLPDNSIIFPTPEDKYLSMFNQADQQIQTIAQHISNRTSNPLPKRSYSGAKPLGKSMETLAIRYLGFNKISANEQCNGCGICEKVCPVRNITLEDGKAHWQDHCQMCFGCLHNCPKQCATYKRLNPKKSFQYKNPKVSLNELIQSNHQCL